MDRLIFEYGDSLVPEGEIKALCPRLARETGAMESAKKEGYADDRASISLPYDAGFREDVKGLVETKKDLDPRYLVVVGIGGSNLGTMAVQEAVLGRHYNEGECRLKVLYADTVDPDSMARIAGLVDSACRSGDEVLINCISKSGRTTETMANFEVLKGVLRKRKKDHKDNIVVTTDAGSALWKLADKKGFSRLEIPSKVGGRYSVHSPVGLFPLAMLGLDIETLHAGARDMIDMCLGSGTLEDPAAVSAALMYMHHGCGRRIHDLFLYSKDLECLGKWYRQLMGESVGKEYDLRGERVNAGITPTVSIGSIDLHSVAQLYLGGPDDRFTSFVSVVKTAGDARVPPKADYECPVPGIRGRSLKEIMDAILAGTKEAYRQAGRPFMEVRIPEKNEYCLGQFLQFKMLEMMYLGSLFEVNPFDQPNVESYKRETRKILGEKH